MSLVLVGRGSLNQLDQVICRQVPLWCCRNFLIGDTLDANTSPFGPQSEEGLPSYGNPEEFFGFAIVAFVDLLGFSRSVRDHWNLDDQSSLAKLLRIKDSVQGWQRTKFIVSEPITPPKPLALFQSRIHTVSDSIVLTHAIDVSPTYGDLWMSLGAVFGGLGYIWERAVQEGYTIRGAVELGPIYWNPTETIGPAFLDVYSYECQMAQWSRILVGPALLDALPQFRHHVDPPHNSLSVSQDALIEIAPSRFQSETAIASLKQIEVRAGSAHRHKYQPLISQLVKGPRRVIPDDIPRAKKEFLSRRARLARRK